MWLDDGPTPILYISLMLFMNAKIAKKFRFASHQKSGFQGRGIICKFALQMKRIVYSIIVMSCVGIGEAHAAGAIADTVSLHEVEVVAIKTHGPELPEAVSATVVGREEAERLNIQALKGLSDLVPNFFVPDYGSRITSSIYVRGLGARMDQAAVGLTVDNVPFLNKDAYDVDVPDIVRLEMLRGPQSTLFGRNTMCGLINITTLSPLSWQGVRLQAEYGSADSYRASASAYWKCPGGLGLSLTAQASGTDGFYDNKFNGEKVGRERQYAARFKTDWIPHSSLRISNALFVSNLNQSGYPYRYATTGEIDYNDTCFYRRFLLADGLTAVYNINDNVSLSSITSFQLLHDNMTLDQDFLPLDYFTLTQRKREYGLTQDFVVKNRQKRAFNWIGGLFGFYRHTDMHAPVTFGDVGIRSLIEDHRNASNPTYPISWDARSFTLGSDFSIPTYGLAGYGQIDCDIAASLTVTAGLRLDYEHSMLRYRSMCNTGYTVFHDGVPFGHVPVDIDQRGSLSRHFLELLPKLSVTYTPSDMITVYAVWTKGYKAGGFNTQMFSDVLQQKLMNIMGIGSAYDVDKIVGYKPEKSWNYEAGAHLDFLNGRLQADLSAFFIDCKDQQLTMFPDGTTTGRIMTNAGSTSSFGGELSIIARPAAAVGIRIAYGYTNARFRKFFNGKADYSGMVIPYAPAHTLFLQGNYSMACGRDISLCLEAHASGAGKIYWNESNTLSQPFYVQLGASVSASWRDLQIQLWGENLTDTRFDTFYFMSMKNEFLQKGKPIRCGVTLRYNFIFPASL